HLFGLRLPRRLGGEPERTRKKQVARVAAPEILQEAALQSSTAERRAMEVERAILDIYRCFYMIDHIGERFEGTISAFVGSGAFVTLDDPFVDVLVKLEDFGGDFVIEDDGLMATSKRSGDAIRLGERIMVEVTDCAILRRTVYARRLRGDAEDGEGARRFRPREDGGGGRPKRGREERPGRGSSQRNGDGRGARDARGSTARDGTFGSRTRGDGRPQRDAKPGARKGAGKGKNKGGPGPSRKKGGKKRR
ncbi:MAG TPA: S1 RNA-binding domain-containing protein, partial [Labilithrix sp.]|nr:S1 RNA-binding domain-containing protein [Labilithrix sp.]